MTIAGQRRQDARETIKRVSAYLVENDVEPDSYLNRGGKHEKAAWEVPEVKYNKKHVYLAEDGHLYVWGEYSGSIGLLFWTRHYEREEWCRVGERERGRFDGDYNIEFIVRLSTPELQSIAKQLETLLPSE